MSVCAQAAFVASPQSQSWAACCKNHEVFVTTTAVAALLYSSLTGTHSIVTHKHVFVLKDGDENGNTAVRT